MALHAFQHVNTRSADVERTRAFYERLGLRVGDRPPFASRGYWLYPDGRRVYVDRDPRMPQQPEPRPFFGGGQGGQYQ